MEKQNAESKANTANMEYLNLHHEAVRLFRDIYREALRAARIRLTIEEILLRRARGPQC
ncbi:MAG: hypothetical protein WAP34_00625 [Desulfomonilia bacterium]